MKITMDYPSLDEEVNILERHHSNAALVKLDDITPALTKEELLTLRAFMKNVFVDRTLLQYIALIVQQTRTSKACVSGSFSTCVRCYDAGVQSLCSLAGT